ncbi:MAG TPA: MlaD family protein [Saprospiraceae bacterium]|nr:MlaD family protein [Saprospiraceae bacterium]
MKISNEFKIGLMAIIVVAISVWGYQFLRGRNVLKASNSYFVRYDDVGQLPKSSPVLIHGISVGTVSNVELDPNLNSIIVTLTLDKGLKIPADAEAVIISTGLMGGKAVELRVSGPCTGDACAKAGSFLKGSVKGFFDAFLDTGPNGTLDKVKQQIHEILKTVSDSLTSPNSDNAIAKTYTDFSHLINNLEGITGTLNRSMGTYDRHLQASLANVETITGALAKNQDKIASSIAHLESISRQLDSAKVGANVGTLINNANAAMKELNSTMADAKVTFNQLSLITQDLQSGKGTLGKMMKDPSLYDNLNRTTKNLDLFLQDFRLNPKRYVNVSVFGKKQKEYEVPEDDPAFRDDTIK